MSYSEWQKALEDPAQKVAARFETMLRDHFTTFVSKNGGIVEREPTLSNGSRPDFRIEDSEGLACFVEAKALFTSRKKSDYFKWRVDLSDIQHPQSGGIAHYRIEGEMTQDLSETEKESIRTWMQGLDPSATLAEPWPYHRRTFPCGSAACEINVAFINYENSVIWCLSKSGPKWRHRIEEKINEILHYPKTGHEKYTRKALRDTPLVLAILDVSTSYIVDPESELYGSHFIT